MLYVLEATVETLPAGPRKVAIEKFYRGIRCWIRVRERSGGCTKPVPTAEEILRLYKVSRRTHMDISRSRRRWVKKNDEAIGTIRIAAVGGADGYSSA